MKTLVEKKKCLIIFAHPHIHSWENEIINKFKIIYNVEFRFADEIFRSGGSMFLINKINEIISKLKIDIVIFDTDFSPYIDSNVINLVDSSVYKILITFDNIVHGNLNFINGSCCDLVLTYDPLDVFKFREKNIKALFFPLEDTNKNFKFLNLKKEIDVLFFGDLNKFGRKIFIEELKKRGINVYNVGPPNNIKSEIEIVELINKSHIVLNLSFTNSFEDFDIFFPSNEDHIKRPLLQFKGRILQVGLCKTVCISEYAPSINLLFSNDEVPIFNNVNECVNLVKDILSSNFRENQLASNLHDKIVKEYSNEVIMLNIYNFIESNLLEISIRKFDLNKYYKKYITRFKLHNSIYSHKLIFTEFHYLIKSKLFYFDIEIILFLFNKLLTLLRDLIIKIFLKILSFFKKYISASNKIEYR